MNEIIKMVAAKTGMSDAVAKMAVDIVISQLKDRLPEGIAGQIDGLLEGGKSTSQMGDIAGKLGGLFGK